MLGVTGAEGRDPRFQFCFSLENGSGGDLTLQAQLVWEGLHAPRWVPTRCDPNCVPGQFWVLYINPLPLLWSDRAPSPSPSDAMALGRCRGHEGGAPRTTRPLNARMVGEEGCLRQEARPPGTPTLTHPGV